MFPVASCVALSSAANAAWRGLPKRRAERPPERVTSGEQRWVISRECRSLAHLLVLSPVLLVTLLLATKMGRNRLVVCGSPGNRD